MTLLTLEVDADLIIDEAKKNHSKSEAAPGQVSKHIKPFEG